MTRITLAQIDNLDMADRILRVANIPPIGPWHHRIVKVLGWGVPNSNSRGDRWHDCWVEVEYECGCGLRQEAFEAPQQRSKAALMVSREVRDVANDRLGGRP